MAPDSESQKNPVAASGEVVGAIACLLLAVAAFLWVFDLPKWPSPRTLPCYSLCISEYASSAFPITTEQLRDQLEESSCMMR